jgi:hypothetical protein
MAHSTEYDFFYATRDSAAVNNVVVEAYRYGMRRYCGIGHGAAIAMMECGTTNDLPYLFAALKRIAPTNDAELICTTSHMLDAIEKITSARPGTSFPAWEKWWKDTHGTDIPVAEPAINAMSPEDRQRTWKILRSCD